MLIEQIKAQQVVSRKNRDSFRIGVLTTLLGEAEKIGKDAGNRQTTDEECIRTIKKFVKNINETLKITDKKSDVLNKELDVLSEFLPDEMSENDIAASIAQIISEMQNDDTNPIIVIGTVMRVFKAQYIDANYDGKTVSNIIRGQLS